MAGFFRRFTAFPPLSVIDDIEGVVVVDLIPSGVFVGRDTGTVCLVGEWPKGPFNTPTLVEGDATIRDTFGGFSLSLRDPLAPTVNPYSKGCAYTWLKGKTFRRLVLVRVDMTLAEGVKIQLTGTPTPLASDVRIPAGTRVRNSGAVTQEFALAQDVVFASGTDLTAATATAFDATNLSRTYSTRTVSGIPVYSVQGVSEGAVGQVNQVDSTDLFRAGIGAGTALPSIVVAVATGALDGAGANAAALTVINSATIDTRYGNAITASLPGSTDTDNIEIIAAARQSQSIRTALATNARDSSAISTGRVALIRPAIGTLPAAATGAGDPGVGANRSDRAFYCYPHFEQNIPEIAELDGAAAISSPNILLGADSAMATLLSNLPPENNPGQSTQEFVSGGLLNFIRKLEDGLTTTGQPTKFTLTNYTAFKAAGVAALRRDPRLSEWVFQSGVTSVDPASFPSLVPMKRRRMADFLQDSLASIALSYNKQPNTSERYDSLVGDLASFLDLMLSAANPAAQRIAAYGIDSRGGNTVLLQGSGIRVIIVSITLLDSLDDIVLQTEIGESVVVSAPVT